MAVGQIQTISHDASSNFEIVISSLLFESSSCRHQNAPCGGWPGTLHHNVPKARTPQCPDHLARRAAGEGVGRHTHSVHPFLREESNGDTAAWDQHAMNLLETGGQRFPEYTVLTVQTLSNR